MKQFTKIIGCLLAACAFVACSETDSTWDPYHNWKERNAQWYESVADSARRAISEAKSQYGNDWESHCQWRMYKTLQKAQGYDTGSLTDSICVKIKNMGEVDGLLANFNDTVRVCFRGWLMETQYDNGDGDLYSESHIFTQTYEGEYNPQTAAPSLSPVKSMVEGFQTALQYMPKGADWFVYIPNQLAYGEKSQTDIPAYSTLLFRINMVDIYRAGTGVSSWKVRKQ